MMTQKPQEAVSKAIAEAGYTTEFDKKNEGAYQNLPSCCQYKE